MGELAGWVGATEELETVREGRDRVRVGERERERAVKKWRRDVTSSYS